MSKRFGGSRTGSNRATGTGRFGGSSPYRANREPEPVRNSHWFGEWEEQQALLSDEIPERSSSSAHARTHARVPHHRKRALGPAGVHAKKGRAGTRWNDARGRALGCIPPASPADANTSASCSQSAATRYNIEKLQTLPLRLDCRQEYCWHSNWYSQDAVRRSLHTRRTRSEPLEVPHAAEQEPRPNWRRELPR